MHFQMGCLSDLSMDALRLQWSQKTSRNKSDNLGAKARLTSFLRLGVAQLVWPSFFEWGASGWRAAGHDNPVSGHVPNGLSFPLARKEVLWVVKETFPGRGGAWPRVDVN